MSLAAMLADQPDWYADAACAYADPGLFFPGHGENPVEAIAICNTCDVRDQCLQHAQDTGQFHGVWGGVPERERRRLRGHDPRQGQNRRTAWTAP